MKNPLLEFETKEEVIEQAMFWWYSVSPPKKLIDLLGFVWDAAVKKSSSSSVS